jgi:hypothetical protein
MNEFQNIDLAIKLAHKCIQIYDWFPFGKKHFEVDCIGFEKAKEPYMKTNQLPTPCNECYKALIMWDKSFSDENMANLFKMLNSLDFDYRGKLNNGVVVFYLRDREECIKFTELLKQKIAEFNVKGFTQWRRACKEFQVLKPQLWKNAKEFIPDLKSA